MVSLLTAPNVSFLKPLKKQFENFLDENILLLGKKNKLRDACEYALLNGGKRVRPLIVMMIAKALGNGLEVLNPALSAEYFHTASLIADDLPCMDNDDFRRNKPALHKMFGETVALLSSYALISAGYEKIYQGAQFLKGQDSPISKNADKICAIALDAATRCAGVSGAVGGQFKDLFPENKSLGEIVDIIYKKTITLFEISFVYGWIFGGGNLEKVEEIRKVSYHFGMAFQIWDDIGDVEQDGKDSINIAQVLGLHEAKNRLKSELEDFESQMKTLGLFSKEFAQLTQIFS